MKKHVSIVFMSVFCILSLPSLGVADVSPGDVIDKTNWQKVENLLPESILNWVKNGDFTLPIGQLSYDPKDFYPPGVRNNFQSNVGKYAIDENDLIIDVATGKLPEFVEGIPFPEIDYNDPKAAQKLMYNKNYLILAIGGFVFPGATKWVGRSGFEREVTWVYYSAAMDGYPEARSVPNPDNIERMSIVKVTSPADVAGTAQLLWRYRDDRQDINMSYLPAIRRVRRMSPANRSDAFVGSDFCIDDAWAYDGKLNMMQWRVIGRQEGLLPYSSTNPDLVVQNSRGEWQTTPSVPRHVYGYETKGWQGAPWAPVSFVWVKRPIWIIEAVSKDPYYNYGKQILWCDPETFNPSIKGIHDRAGVYWKTFYGSVGPGESADKTMHTMQVCIQNIVDDRLRHAGVAECLSPRWAWTYFARVNINDFTLAGFQKYCK